MDKNKALSILELGENFTREDMIQSFRKKLFVIHPDTSRDVYADIKIDDLISSRRFLEELLKNKKESSKKESRENDEGYLFYREGMRILHNALDSYWKNRLHYSHRPAKASFITKFHEDLDKARDSFIKVLNQYPGGLWTPDAVEEIARINDWLGAENDAG